MLRAIYLSRGRPTKQLAFDVRPTDATLKAIRQARQRDSQEGSEAGLEANLVSNLKFDHSGARFDAVRAHHHDELDNVEPPFATLNFGNEGLPATEFFGCLHLRQAGAFAGIPHHRNQLVVELTEDRLGESVGLLHSYLLNSKIEYPKKEY